MDGYTDERTADAIVIHNLLKELRSYRQMSLFKLADGRVIEVASYIILNDDEVQERISDAKKELEQLTGLVSNAAEDTPPEEATPTPEPQPAEVPAPQPQPETPAPVQPQPEVAPQPTPEQPQAIAPVVIS